MYRTEFRSNALKPHPVFYWLFVIGLEISWFSWYHFTESQFLINNAGFALKLFKKAVWVVCYVSLYILNSSWIFYGTLLDQSDSMCCDVLSYTIKYWYNMDYFNKIWQDLLLKVSKSRIFFRILNSSNQQTKHEKKLS